MATYHHLGLFSHSPYLQYAGIAGGLLCLGIAANAVVFPAPALSLLGLAPPPSSAPKGSAGVHPAAQGASASPADPSYLRDVAHLYAVRDAALGTVVLAAAYFKDVRTLGWAMIAGGAVAAVDGFVNARRVKGGEWIHWPIAPVGLGLGAALLGAFDRF